MAFTANLLPFVGILAIGALFAIGHHRFGRG